MNIQELEKSNKVLERRSRVILIILILFILLQASFFTKNYFFSKSNNGSSNQYDLIDPARTLISQENFIINIQPLRVYLNTLAKEVGEQNISLYYEQLNSGANISISKDLRLFPASLTKLPLAIIVARKVEDKIWNWDTKLKIEAEDIDAGSGDLFKKVQAGSEMTVEELLASMIVDSDNTAQSVFLRHVGEFDLKNFEEEIGLDSLFDERGYVSAKEFSRILRVLWVSSYLKRENSQKILKLMSEEKFDEYLSEGIPKDITFAHKYGENIHFNIFADSGIVYQNGHPFMITVILKGKDATLATRSWAIDIMKKIAEKAIEQGR